MVPQSLKDSGVQTAIPRTEPSLTVGIVDAKRLRLTLDGSFLEGNTGRSVSGTASVSPEGDGVALELASGMVIQAPSVILSPIDMTSACFVLHDVKIGKGFHWEQSEEQKFLGELMVLRVGGHVGAVNRIGLERYLISVISSEMSGGASLEFLKAHAIISRSWLIAQVLQEHREADGAVLPHPSMVREAGRSIQWYDRETHDLFDVCADDHCQRYQGIPSQAVPVVEQAVRETRGFVLMSGGEVCDARFSKSCGGISEPFENVWAPEPHAYLVAVRDARQDIMPDLTKEDEARRWILTEPPSFCNIQDEAVLARILPPRDREKGSLYRWTVSYSQEDLRRIVKSRTGIDLGEICALIPVRRGPSARLLELRIEGTRSSMNIGKELEIRRVLSQSHLYSAAFVVDAEDIHAGVPGRFVLHGAGWGHGVGLCQTGAGVMGEQGFSCSEILAHYYRGATIEQAYK